MSRKWSNAQAAVWLGLGLLAGLIVAGFWPSVPMHATATDKVDTFSMATGFAGDDVEAVYFLDHLTGDLYAYIVGRAANGAVGPVARYYRNIADDFKAGEKARYLMATGIANLVRGGRANFVQPGKAVLYIAELSSGTAVGYGLPFNAPAYRAGQVLPPGELTPVCQFAIRKPVGESKPSKRGRGKEE